MLPANKREGLSVSSQDIGHWTNHKPVQPRRHLQHLSLSVLTSSSHSRLGLPGGLFLWQLVIGTLRRYLSMTTGDWDSQGIFFYDNWWLGLSGGICLWQLVIGTLRRSLSMTTGDWDSKAVFFYDNWWLGLSGGIFLWQLVIGTLRRSLSMTTGDWDSQAVSFYDNWWLGLWGDPFLWQLVSDCSDLFPRVPHKSRALCNSYAATVLSGNQLLNSSLVNYLHFPSIFGEHDPKCMWYKTHIQLERQLSPWKINSLTFITEPEDIHVLLCS
jgi:hypothetical protein